MKDLFGVTFFVCCSAVIITIVVCIYSYSVEELHQVKPPSTTQGASDV